MKKNIFLLLIIMTLSSIVSCTPDTVLPEVPQEEQQDSKPEDRQEDITPPAPDPEPEPEPEPEPVPNPDDVFELVSGSCREVFYNAHRIAVRVKSNCGIVVEIPEDAKHWISECDGYNRSRGYIGLQIESLPQTSIGDSLIPDTCSNEERTAVIVLRNATGTKSAELTIRQLCYGCSRGIEEGDDIVVEY